MSIMIALLSKLKKQKERPRRILKPMREIQSQDVIERQRIEAQLRQSMTKQVEQEFARIVQIREEEVKRFEKELKREIEEQQQQYRIDAQALQVELGQYCINFDALQFSKNQDQIESGASGTVYKGKYNGQFVAIKVYHGEADSDDTIHNLKHEVNVIKSQNTLHTLQRVGTPVYMAKEMFNTYVKKLSSEDYKKVDIYAFGILMYEILSGQVPFFEKHFSDMYELRRHIENGGRPCVDPGWLQSIIVLMEDCWEENANDRPCFKLIAQTLQRMMNSNDREVLNWYEQQPKSNSATKEQRQPSTSAPQPVVLHAQFDDDYELALALQRSMVEM